LRRLPLRPASGAQRLGLVVLSRRARPRDRRPRHWPSAPRSRSYKEGDRVAVGCMVDSCQHCDQCHKGEEQLCREGNTQTYNGRDRITGEPTYGGYSKHLVVREEFVLSVPDGWTSPRPRPCCAPASRPTRRSRLGTSTGKPRRRDRPRRPGPYGGQAGRGPRRRRDGHEPLGRQGSRRARNWRPRPAGLKRRGRHGGRPAAWT
jgi:hypothetical protein